MEYEDEYDQEEEEEAKPRLNMSHGFIHHIRRNQIDRDNYDKKLKSQSKNAGRHQKVKKRTESQLYVPPNRSSPSKSQPSHEEERRDNLDSNGRLLFKLEYTTNDGNVHTLMVKQGDEAAKLAKRLTNQAGIPQDLLQTLTWKIEQEQLKRS